MSKHANAQYARILGEIKAHKKPHYMVVKLTSEVAQLLMENHHYEENRGKRHKNIRQFSWHMANDSWAMTGQPIIFGTNGKILDGQHRIKALAASGEGGKAEMALCFGIDPDAYMFMDVGSPKTPADYLGFKKVPHHAAMAAATRWLILLETDSVTNRETYEPFVIQYWYTVRYQGMGIQDKLPIAQLIHRVGYPIGPALALYTIISQIDADKATAFMEAIAAVAQPGYVPRGREKPVARMHGHLVDLYHKSFKRVNDIVRIGCMIKAWNLFVNNRSNGKVSWSNEKAPDGEFLEPFPEIAGWDCPFIHAYEPME